MGEIQRLGTRMSAQNRAISGCVTGLEKAWDELAVALDQTGIHNNETERFLVILHLVQLFTHLHEADVDQQSDEANGY